MNFIPQENRGYTLAFVALVMAFGLAVIVLFKQPSQWSFVLDWVKELMIYFVPLVIGAKEVGKIAGRFAPSNGTAAPPTTTTPTQ